MKHDEKQKIYAMAMWISFAACGGAIGTALQQLRGFGGLLPERPVQAVPPKRFHRSGSTEAVPPETTVS